MNPVIIVTGSAKRIGKAILNYFHQNNYNVVVHANTSLEDAENLSNDLNNQRSDSAILVTGDLQKIEICKQLVTKAVEKWGRLDALVNNASIFFPTKLSDITESDWNRIVNINVKACLFLSKFSAPYLKKTQGSIINMTDIYAGAPKKNHSVYCLSKAALHSLTLSLAQELAPDIRVNAIAPGPALSSNIDGEISSHVDISKTLLSTEHIVNDIVSAAYFFAKSKAITGQVISVDAGKTLSY